MDTKRMQRTIALLNDFAAKELRQHRHRYNTVGCKPHPHEGPHIIKCACGQIRR